MYAGVLIGISLVLLGIGIYRALQVKSKADFIVAGRKLGWPVLVFTLLSSWIGSGSLFAGAQNAVERGFSAAWLPAGGLFGLLAIGFIAGRARRFGEYTVPDLLEVRYNRYARLLGAMVTVIAFTVIVSYQFKGGGDILALVFPGAITSTQGMYIIAGYVILFTAMAGMNSIAYMDLAMGLLVSVTALIALPVLIGAAGGWSGVTAALPAEHFTIMGPLKWYEALNYFLPTMLLLMGNQTMFQKFFSAKSERDAKISVAGWFVGIVVLETVIITLAVVGSSMIPKYEEILQRKAEAGIEMRSEQSPASPADGGIPAQKVEPRAIIPTAAVLSLPALLGALLMGGIFGQVISTANNYLFSPATNLVHDIYHRFIRPQARDREVLMMSRILVVALGVVALVMAAHTESVLAMALYGYTMYGAVVTPVVMAAFFWKRANAAGALASILAGTVTTVVWGLLVKWELLVKPWADMDAVIPALILSVTSLVVVSLLTAPPPEEKWRALMPEGA